MSLSIDSKCFVSFELFEHLHDPGRFLNTVFRLMSKGDIFIFTTLSGTGLDIQILGEKIAFSISPSSHKLF